MGTIFPGRVHSHSEIGATTRDASHRSTGLTRNADASSIRDGCVLPDVDRNLVGFLVRPFWDRAEGFGALAKFHTSEVPPA